MGADPARGGATDGASPAPAADGAAGPGAVPAGARVPAQQTPDTGARTDQAAALVTGARGRIDELDTRIIELVRERMAVSAAIQEARITSGGRRVNLSREMEILHHYRETLGKPGTALAMTLLELCRGRV
ncbi:chorismate mutase [Streptomyces zingiberis]|uniref:Chorismate mutase n=1 Tax=Streptomyces zingiberis TaxID=2053010 RepID=A0ABX1BWS5_9ACTN|nr:chorismate mutase [Streptomyces zingiberis]